MFYISKEILISERGFTKTNYERLIKTIGLYKTNLVDFDDNMYLTVYSLIEINYHNNWFR